MTVNSVYLKSVLFVAVREDRTPGGARKNKKLRMDDESSIMSSIFNSVVVDAYDDHMIQALVDANPDMIPSADGAGISLPNQKCAWFSFFHTKNVSLL